MVWTALMYVGVTWVVIRQVGHLVGIIRASLEGDEQRVVSIATVAAQDGLIVIALLVITVPFVLPGLIRTKKVRQLTDGGVVLIAVANAELRALLITRGRELSLLQGRFHPRMLYSATLSADSSGVRFWAGLGKQVGFIPANLIREVRPASQSLGVLSPPAVELKLVDGATARFTLATERFPWVSSLGAGAVAQASDRVTRALQASAKPDTVGR